MDLDPLSTNFTCRGLTQPPLELESIGALPSGFLAVLLQRRDWQKNRRRMGGKTHMRVDVCMYSRWGLRRSSLRE